MPPIHSGPDTYRQVRLRNLVREGWSGIYVEFKRRANLIPSLGGAFTGAIASSAGAPDGHRVAAAVFPVAAGNLFNGGRRWPSFSDIPARESA